MHILYCLFLAITIIVSSSCSHISRKAKSDHTHNIAYEAAPKGHELILENKDSRVLKVILPPGGIVPLHTHEFGGIIIIVKSSMSLIKNAKGEIVSKAKPPLGAVSVPGKRQPHSIENIGKDTMHLYRVEMKR